MLRRILTGVLLAMLCVDASAQAATQCPISGQSSMLIARLYFGTRMPGGQSVSESQWRSFLASAVTPRFPDGFTVYKATGQWRDRQTKTIATENSRMVEIAAPDANAARTRIEEVTRLYREKFHQQSVGIVTNTECASF